MQFCVEIIDWNQLHSRMEAGTLAEDLFDADGESDWSDSCLDIWGDSASEFLMTCEAYAKARPTLPSDVMEQADATVGRFFQETGPACSDFERASEIEGCVGSFSPESVLAMLARLDAAPLTEIRTAIAAHVDPPYFTYGDGASDYLDQWVTVFRVAAERGHGILFSIG